jgi:hypothetical protein
MELAGIKYTNDPTGQKRYVHVDLKVHGKNQLLEDFLDGLEAQARQGEETVSLDEFNRYIDEKLNTTERLQCSYAHITNDSPPFCG